MTICSQAEAGFCIRDPFAISEGQGTSEREALSKVALKVLRMRSAIPLHQDSYSVAEGLGATFCCIPA